MARTSLTVGAIASTALWLGTLLLLRVARQPRAAKAAPATDDLRPEPPAVANMLANNFRPTREAVPATLFDLAARGYLSIDLIGGGQHVVRLRAKPTEPLTFYERGVLMVLHRRARDGAIPAGALTTGPKEWARGWWRSFRKSVERDARDRGLSRDLWNRQALGYLTVPILAGAVFFGLRTLEPELAVGYAILSFGLAAGMIGSGRQRDTPAGLEAAGHWLGVRRYLRSAALDHLPPSAVAIWERYLAYGAALGAADHAVETIPMGADADHRAWSSFGGGWRELRIRYPRLWPPAWGRRPGLALLSAIAAGAVAVLLVRVAVGIGWPFGSDIPTELLFMQILILLLWVLGTALALWSAVTLVRASGDLGGARELTGLVVRKRERGGGDDSEPRRYVAVDDGTSSRIRAFRVNAHLFVACPPEYEEAVVTATRLLGHVRAIRPAGS
jgi:hypothetical protein